MGGGEREKGMRGRGGGGWWRGQAGMSVKRVHVWICFLVRQTRENFSFWVCLSVCVTARPEREREEGGGGGGEGGRCQSTVVKLSFKQPHIKFCLDF